MIITRHFIVSGMQCPGCEDAIAEAVAALPGIKNLNSDYGTGQVDVEFDDRLIQINAIQDAISQKGYPIESDVKQQRHPFKKFVLTIISVSALVAVIILARKVWHQFTLPEINSQLSDAMIFGVGLITGLHCLGMCGGFVLSYTAKDAENGRPSYWSHLLYGFGKTVSYALFGAFFGFVGSLISITPFIRGVTAIAAGLFLVLFGLKMLGVFSILRRFHINQPESMTRFAVEKRRRSKSPLFIGFFSGLLLGCGPLQAMYVMAAGTSDPLMGAKILTLFGLGTLPALLSFGFLTNFFSATMTHRFFQVSGVILIFIGAMMLNKGLLKTNSGYDFQSLKQQVSSKMHL